MVSTIAKQRQFIIEQGSGKTGDDGTKAVTFSKPFTEAPNVYFTTSQSSTNRVITVTYTANSAAGFTAVSRKAESSGVSVATDISFRWIAIQAL